MKFQVSVRVYTEIYNDNSLALKWNFKPIGTEKPNIPGLVVLKHIRQMAPIVVSEGGTLGGQS